MTDARARDWAILLGIVLLAAALRLHHLGASLWYDEVLTLVEFVRLPLRQIVTTYTSLNNHVFYSLQAHLSVGAFGETAAALRYPAVAFGMLAIPVFWLLCRQIRLPMAWAHLATLLLAVSYHHIWFSQNARGYTGLFFWCLVALMLFLRGSRGGGLAPWLGIAATGGLALYTHLSGVFFFLALGVVYAIAFLADLVRRDPLWAAPVLAGVMPLAGFLLAAALSIALHAPMLPQMIETFTAVTPDGGPEAVTEWRNPLWTALAIVESVPGPMPVKLIALPAVLIVIALGIVETGRREPLFNMVFFAHVAVTLGILVALSFRIWPRYFLFDLAFLTVYAIAGSFALAGLIGRVLRLSGGAVRALGMAGCIAGVLLSAALTSRNYAYPKQDFAAAVSLVRERMEEGDVAVSFGLAATPISAYFAPEWEVVETPEHLAALEDRAGRVWVVHGFPVHTARSHPEIMARLETAYEEVAYLPGTLANGAVLVWRSVPEND